MRTHLQMGWMVNGKCQTWRDGETSNFARLSQVKSSQENSIIYDNKRANKSFKTFLVLQYIKILWQFCEKNSIDSEKNIKTKKKRDCKTINIYFAEPFVTLTNIQNNVFVYSNIQSSFLPPFSCEDHS